jgi:hypothetical protein
MPGGELGPQRNTDSDEAVRNAESLTFGLARRAFSRGAGHGRAGPGPPAAPRPDRGRQSDRGRVRRDRAGARDRRGRSNRRRVAEAQARRRTSRCPGCYPRRGWERRSRGRVPLPTRLSKRHDRLQRSGVRQRPARSCEPVLALRRVCHRDLPPSRRCVAPGARGVRFDVSPGLASPGRQGATCRLPANGPAAPGVAFNEKVQDR